jgi:hypothetical protein
MAGVATTYGDIPGAVEGQGLCPSSYASAFAEEPPLSPRSYALKAHTAQRYGERLSVAFLPHPDGYQ